MSQSRGLVAREAKQRLWGANGEGKKLVASVEFLVESVFGISGEFRQKQELEWSAAGYVFVSRMKLAEML